MVDNARPSVKDLVRTATLYLSKGWVPVPVPHRSKGPTRKGWQQLTAEYVGTHIAQLFPEGSNMGLLLGTPSNGLVDVDLDCPEAVRAAGYLLPETDMVSGRKSAPRSHYWYQIEGGCPRTQKFKDTNGATLAELRGTGGQTVAPPSLHDGTGELIAWDRPGGCPTIVAASELRAAVGAVGAAALLARHWPAAGSRHDAALALSAGLARAGWAGAAVEEFVGAVAEAAGDEELRDRLATVASTEKRLRDGRTATGWPTLIRTVGKEVVDLVCEWLGTATGSPAEPPGWEPLVPLTEPPAWPAPLDRAAFCGLPGEVVDCLSPHSEADPAAILIQFLVAFGNNLGRTAHFCAEGSDHYLNEFAVLVGKTSKGRKGSSWAQVLRPFKAVEDRPAGGLVVNVVPSSWSEACVQAGGLSSGEGVIWHVRDPVMGREKVKEKGLPARYVETETDPGVREKRLMLVEEEFAKVLKQTERQGNTLSPTLRQAWDGKSLQTLTKNSPAKATGAHVSLIGHITADELRRYLSATETANGFGNRFLWLCVKRSKCLPEGGAVDEGTMTWIGGQLRKALEFGKGAGEMRRDEEAKVLWAEVYEELSEGKPGLAWSLLARGEPHVMRLACLYAILDGVDKVMAHHLKAALAIWRYVEQSVLYVFGDSLGDPLADEILQLLRAAAGQGLSRTEISDAFGRNRSGDRIGRALGLLLEHKRARFERVDTAGRPGERWYLV